MIEKLRRARRLYRWLQQLASDPEAFGLVRRKPSSSPKDTKVLVGTMLAQLNQSRTVQELRDVEFQVFSQYADDGIIQYLVHNLPVEERRFVEFGVENYTEANTRFLLIKDKWAGLVLDGSLANVAYIQQDPIAAYYNLTARQAFITADNINQLLEESGFTGRIGLLSIDIDGMDYWVWKAISVAEPAIVVAEYNATFGPDRSITVPYKPDFVRSVAHPSYLYYGCSLSALQDLAREKGYEFIGCNSAGNNAYFVRNDLAAIPWLASLDRHFSPAIFAEHAIGGRRVRGAAVLEVIRGLPVFNSRTGLMEDL